MAAAGAGDPEWKTDLVIVAVRLPRDDREDERLRAFAATHVPVRQLRLAALRLADSPLGAQATEAAPRVCTGL